MEFTIRAATPDDTSAIRAVGEAVWPVTYAFAGQEFIRQGLATWWSVEAITSTLATTTTFVVQTDGRVVAVGNVDLRPDVPVIWKLYVLPDCQGHGVGGALLERLVASVPQERGRVAIEYVDGNDRAAAVYAKHGFVETRREPAERSDWPDQIWAERVL